MAVEGGAIGGRRSGDDDGGADGGEAPHELGVEHVLALTAAGEARPELVGGHVRRVVGHVTGDAMVCTVVASTEGELPDGLIRKSNPLTVS